MKSAYTPLFLILLLAVIFISGCVSDGEQKTVGFTELKSNAQNLNSLMASYNGINSDLNYGANAQSATSALTYFRSAVDKTKALNDKTLESKVDAIVAKLENNEDNTQEVLSAFGYMSTNINNRCISLSNKVTQEYSANIVDSSNAFKAKDQKLTDILQDVSGLVNAQSATLASSYANSALNKARGFGDSKLITILDGLVSALEKSDNQNYRNNLIAFYIYAESLEVNECQNLVNIIMSS